jgi:hypothetical protein
MDLTEIGFGGIVWIDLVQDRVNMVMILRVSEKLISS